MKHIRNFDSSALFVLTLFILTAFGCAVEVKTRFDGSAAFPAYKTYCWIEGCGSLIHSGTANRDTAMENRLRRILVSELERKNLRLVAGNPDLLIALRVTTTDEQTVLYRRPDEVPMQWSAKTESEVLSYTKGSVVVAMADPKTGKLVWESNALSYMDVRPDITDKNLQRVIRGILLEYPPDTETPKKRTNAIY